MYHPELLLGGEWTGILLMAGFAAVSAVALASAVVGQASGRLGLWERAAALTAAALMVARGPWCQVAGLGLYAAVVAWSARRAARGATRPAGARPPAAS